MQEEKKSCVCGTGSCELHGGMKKKMMIGAVLAIGVVVAIVAFSSKDSGGDIEAAKMESKKDVKIGEETGAMMEKKTGEGMKQDDGSMPMKAGSYVPYEEAKLSMAKEGKVVLFFRASWCPTCRALDADIKKNLSVIPADVTILDVDYDKYDDLRKQYGITTQHTLVQVDADGKEIGKWVGSVNLAEIVKNVK